MTGAIWYAILLLLQIVRTDFGEIDVYHDSRLYTSAELSGTVRSGFLVTGGETLGEYESSARYRQVYTIFSAMELMPEDKASIETPAAKTSSADNGSVDSINQTVPTVPEDTGNIRPFLIDFTSVLSDIVYVEEGEEREFTDSDSGTWILRRERNRVSLANPGMELIVIIHF